MLTLLSMKSPVARYLLGDMTPNEMKRIEQDLPSNYSLRREIEAAKEELTAAYALGLLRRKYRLKFETAFLSSEEGMRKMEFVRAWIEDKGASCPDLTSPLHRYVLGNLTSDEEVKIEEKLSSEGSYRRRLDDAENEVLISYFHETLPDDGRELFDAHYLSNHRIFAKLRFAHIISTYERLSSQSRVKGGGIRGRRMKAFPNDHQLAVRSPLTFGG